MQNKLVKIFRILFVLILVTLGVLVLFRPAHTETNILKAIFSSTNDNLLVDLSSRFSAKINVIVESNDPEKAEKISKTFYSKIDKTKMQSSDANITEIIEDYEKYHNNLLSNQTRKYLINKQYNKVEENAYEALYNPVIPPIGSIEDDPFLLLTDFVMNLNGNSQAPANFTPIQLNDKYYSLIMLDVDKELALSPTVLNKEVKNLVELQKELTKGGVKVYLTGAPVHSYFASSHSIFEINLICILSTLFIIGLVFWYFGSLLPLIPIGISIGLGIYVGYCVTALLFKDIHILTFVFSTTLIGVCVDYSLHYFVALKDGKTGHEVLKDILKSLTVSLITTVSAFLILLFADFVLLRQISVFTITGLVTVYGIVVLWYPLLDAARQLLIKAAKQLGSEAAKRNCHCEAKSFNDIVKIFENPLSQSHSIKREFVKLFSLLIKRKLFIFSPLGLCRVKTIDNCFARGLVEFVSELERTYKFKRGVQRHKNPDRATECAMTNVGADSLKIANHSEDNNILSSKNILKGFQRDGLEIYNMRKEV